MLQTGGAENILRSLLDRGLPSEFLAIHGFADNVQRYTFDRSIPLTARSLLAEGWAMTISNVGGKEMPVLQVPLASSRGGNSFKW